MPFTDLEEIGTGKVIVKNVYSGEKSEIDNIDSVIISYLNKTNDEIYFGLKGKVKELYRIGDCLAPRRIQSAILEGHEVGMKI